MKIYQSFQGAVISQMFGPSNITFMVNGKPMTYADLGLKGHNGIDFAGQGCNGKPLYWDCDVEGTVTRIFSDSPTKGCGVYITEKDDDGAFTHIFWHIQPNIQCKLGKIQPGQLIGYLDNTGLYTNGPHLHRGQYPDPIPTGIDPHEYGWAIDPYPFYKPIFILTYLNLNQQISILQKLINLWKQLGNILKVDSTTK
jgi:murein DD-endopeptidase MepM/ murein hydrolase activator NlpD